MINNGIKIEAVNELVQKFQGSENESSILPMEAHIKWVGGLRNEIYIRNFEPLLNDEPQFLGGTDLGANPMEYILGVLGSCMGIIFLMKATGKAVEIESLAMKVKGEVDLKILLGLKEGNRGFSEIKINFEVKSTADSQILQNIFEDAIRESPVGNTLINNVNIISIIKKL